ncbi:carboxypeptidase-like regulatory domain-containing protein [Nibribacter koreensis]|uniref:Alpha-2-macroglobulin domain-containing protein n=1 Tax=Nibribacter koreensis TaxID=1084519 RepID=A0ABP8FXN6_9BACT
MRLLPCSRVFAYWVLLFCFFSLTSKVSAQQHLAQSRTTSYFTYLYKITDAEAKVLYDKGMQAAKQSFFHTKVDSFVTNLPYIKQLPQGHYLYTLASGPDLEYTLFTQTKTQLKLLNNHVDFAAVLLDSLGNILPDAQLQLKNKPVPFDKASQTYRLGNTKKNGLLSVTHNGYTYYVPVSQNIKGGKHSLFKKIVFRKPIYYLWSPFRDIARSLIHWYPQGYVYSAIHLFDDWGYRSSDWPKGYLVLNKPMYMPNDTVRYKAFLVKKNGRPYTKTLLTEITGNGKPKRLGELKAFRPGAYEGSFILHDSLRLRLDTYVALNLSQKKRWSTEQVITTRFKYEDYELKENSYAVRLDKLEHTAGTPNKLYLRGSDANGLTLTDAWVELTVLTKKIKQSNAPVQFIPDTLWVHKQPLESSGETTLLLPDSIFPKATIDYQIRAVFLTSNNERSEKSVNARYVLEEDGQLTLSLLNDSVKADFMKGTASLPKQAVVTLIDGQGKLLQTQKVTLPALLPLQPNAQQYRLTAGRLESTLHLEDQSANLQFYSERTADSLLLGIHNPRKLPFWYFVYKNNHLVDRGQDTTAMWQYSRPATNQEPYYVSVQYLWAGQVESDEYNAPFRKNDLHIALQGPTTVYPGQKTNFTLQVTNSKGKPASNVDVTAYALTSKFKDTSPENLPEFGKHHSRKDRRTFHLKDIPEKGFQLMNWEHWRQTMGLDSLSYYQLLYPSKGIYTNYSTTADKLTQFAPFVVDSGRVVPIHILYLNEVPIYFSGTDVVPPYSFPADSGYHYIRLRTAKHEIELDSVYLQHGQKLILSVDQHKLSYLFTATEKNKLSPSEQEMLSHYLVPVEQNFSNGLTYLKQGKIIQYLPNGSSRNYSQRSNTWDRILVGGPFRPNTMEFISIGNFTTAFTPEANYVHRFEPRLLKMRERKIFTGNFSLATDNKSYRLPSETLAETAYTEEGLQQQWKDTQYNYWLSKILERPAYRTEAGNGRLHWQLDSAFKASPKFVFFYEPNAANHQIAMYAGQVTHLTSVFPKKYKLVLVFPDHRHISTLVTVKPNGELRLHFNPSQLKAPTSETKALEAYLQKSVETAIANASSTVPISTPAPTSILPPSVSYGGFLGYASEVRGMVVDAQTAEGLPGVTVLLKGTTTGVATDADGRYSIQAPGNGVLLFSYIGYVHQEVPVRNSSRIDVKLAGDVKQLQEVVVTGYGVEQALQGRAAGVQVSGNAAPILIRGASTLAGNNPPIIIVDGLPFNGNVADLDPQTIASSTVMKGADATALYGARGANGVIIITTKNGGIRGKQANSLPGLEQELPEGAAAASSIRSYFSDYAFWQPRLVTDNQGKASFTVTFPGDVTSWKTHILGMDGHKRSGQTSTEILSFKAMMASLSGPRFLVEGDKAQIIGKAVNYLPDSARVQTRFELNGKLVREKQLTFGRVYADTFMIQAPAVAPDSVALQFTLKQANSFTDGEQRHIGVYKKGVLERKGVFLSLPIDTTFTLAFDPAKGPVRFYAQSSLLQVMLDEISALHRYEYWCNEQAASKLKGLLWEKRIQETLGKPFEHDKLVKRAIKHLEKAQKEEGTWSWWGNGTGYLWITQHVTEALVMAQKEGYATAFKAQPLIDYLTYHVEKKDSYDKVRGLEILQQLGGKVDFVTYIPQLEKEKQLTLEDQFRLTRLRQKLQMKAPLDTLNEYHQTTTFGGMYWGRERSSLFDSHISNTLLAYEILKAAGGHERDLLRIQAYLLNERRAGYWRNTFESARILETLLPDLVKGKGQAAENQLLVSGSMNATLTKFPVDTTFTPTQPLTLKKTGSMAMYLTAYQNEWVTQPARVDKDFVVRTSFANTKTTIATLEAGKPVELVVDVEVKGDASYVMIEVPIPAGCSYDAKTAWGRNESHREYFRHKVAIFSDRLQKGKYTFTIQLLPRYKGTYTLNPAKAELMYFPTFFGREGLKTVEVK